ncbi:hypothetical protein V8G54_004387 [Vigna mungo]|uniref:Uncharacterized protein n=1 Tax=Vigna mungo TaxID=3915 RepID=A0AAQ3PCH9_VIGMU
MHTLGFLLSGHTKFLGSFSASDISSTMPPLFPEAKNRNRNRFLGEIAKKDEPVPLLFGNSALHWFAPRRKARTVGEAGAANATSDILICEARSIRNEIQLSN